MKRNLLFVLALFTALCTCVNAEITPAQQTDPEYLINSGYSLSTADDILMLKDRALGRAGEPVYEKKHTKLTNFIRGFYTYIDPAMDPPDKRHHNIKTVPHYTDL